jgi:hypothetical protein
MISLYIATHNKTGKKYFGKTTRFTSVEDLQEKYHGSGLYWQRHLKKHGDDVTMEIYGVFRSDEVEEVAIKFSEDNNIVESDLWLNLKIENGLDGNPSGETHPMYGKTHSDEAKKKISDSSKGRIISEKTKLKISQANKGVDHTLENNPMYGKTHSAEAKKKISESREKYRGENHPKFGKKTSDISKEKMREIVKCPHCGKEGGKTGMKAWHFDNCGLKNV